MIDVVIPTYKRIKNLQLLVRSIDLQSKKPNKVTIVYAGITEEDLKEIVEQSSLNIQLIASEPSVCKQRNLGIKNSNSKYIFLCDDDIELPNDYLEKLYTFLEESPHYNIASGEEYRLDINNKWSLFTEKLKHYNLWFKYIFGLSVLEDLSSPYYRSNKISNYVSNKLLSQRNNVSPAGWPRICRFDYPVMETTIYSLEASMVRAKYLKNSLYNENLSQYGIGDNYEVILKINNEKKIAVLRDLYFKHYKAPSNRISTLNSYTQRIKELKRVVFYSSFFTMKNRCYFIWSLIGNSIYFLFKKEWQLCISTIKILNISVWEVFAKQKLND